MCWNKRKFSTSENELWLKPCMNIRIWFIDSYIIGEQKKYLSYFSRNGYINLFYSTNLLDEARNPRKREYCNTTHLYDEISSSESYYVWITQYKYVRWTNNSE